MFMERAKVAGFRAADDGTYEFTLAGRRLELKKVWEVRVLTDPEAASVSKAIRGLERNALRAVAVPWPAAGDWLVRVARDRSGPVARDRSGAVGQPRP